MATGGLLDRPASTGPSWVHPAVKQLPPPGGSSSIVFRDVPQGGGVDGLEQGEARHQADLAYPRLQAIIPEGKELTVAQRLGLEAVEPKCRIEPFVPPEANLATQYTKEQLEEWGYPKYDPKFDDPEWLKEQFRKESEDPRENANFFLDSKDPEFWANVARRPHAKALLRSENHWNSRKNIWLQQFQNVQELNRLREDVAEKLEICSAETKRLVVPVVHYRIMEAFLIHLCKEASDKSLPFEDVVEKPEHRRTLCELRDRIDLEGEKGAEEMWKAYDTLSLQMSLEDAQKEERRKKLTGEGRITDPEHVREALNWALKCKKDGVLEWNEGKIEDAIASWREGADMLWTVQAPETQKDLTKEINEIHAALLKNQAQAAIKLCLWNEALEAANGAVKLDDQDHKAWFRKACALEGLGRPDEVPACLDVIEQIAVGRPDRDRIQKDTTTKREKIREILDKDGADKKRMLQRGCQKELFSADRDKPVLQAAVAPGPARISDKVEVKSLVKVSEETRKRLTKDGAEDLLKELKEVYDDSSFRKQVRKLAHDVNDQGEFICYLNKVALQVQKPVLEKWGFEPTEAGVAEMTRAIGDHTRGANSDAGLRKQAEETMLALYGEFYHVARGAGLNPKDRAAVAKKSTKNDGDGESGSDGEQGLPEGTFVSPAHWTGRPVHGWEGWQHHPDPKKTKAAERKEAWTELSKAMSGSDPEALFYALDRGIKVGLSAVTVRSAKQRLAGIGGRRLLPLLPS